MLNYLLASIETYFICVGGNEGVKYISEISYEEFTLICLIYLFILQGTRAPPTGQLIGNTALTWEKM